MKDRHTHAAFSHVRMICSIFLVVTILLPPMLSAQDYRVNMSVKSVDIYAAMLKFTDNEDYAKIVKSLPIMKTIFSEIKRKFKVDIEAEIVRAIKQQSRTKLKAALLKAVYYDMKDIFYEVNKASGVKGKKILVWIKIATMDFKILEPFLALKSSRIPAAIKEEFINLAPLDKTYANENIEDIRKRINIRGTLNNIEENILSVFPEFK